MTTLSSLYGKGLVSDVAYPTGWDGETDIAPSKNTVYDEMENRVPKSTFTQDSGILVGTGAGTYQAESGATARESILEIADGVANTKLFINAGATAPEWASGVKIGNFTRDISAADGDVGYSGVGFKPSAIILFATINASAASVWGFSTGTANWSVDALSGTYYTTATYLVTIRKAIGDVSQVTLKTFDEDGFTLTYLKAGTPTGTASIGYFALR